MTRSNYTGNSPTSVSYTALKRQTFFFCFVFNESCFHTFLMVSVLNVGGFWGKTIRSVSASATTFAAFSIRCFHSCLPLKYLGQAVQGHINKCMNFAFWCDSVLTFKQKHWNSICIFSFFFLVSTVIFIAAKWVVKEGKNDCGCWNTYSSRHGS